MLFDVLGYKEASSLISYLKNNTFLAKQDQNITNFKNLTEQKNTGLVFQRTDLLSSSDTLDLTCYPSFLFDPL